jgi:hypothetical protein
MATPEAITPSKRLRSAAVAERQRLRRDLGIAEKRIEALRDELLVAEENVSEIRRHLALLAAFAHDQDEDSPFPVPELRVAAAEIERTARQGPLTPPRGYLRGAGIRSVAVRVLGAAENPSRPIHYAEWYRMVADAGYDIAGQDPMATFLTQIGRSPVVKRASEPGVYALDLGAPQRLRERLRALHQELVSLHAGQQTIEEIATIRERRAELTSECARIERALEEATHALGVEPGEPEVV